MFDPFVTQMYILLVQHALGGIHLAIVTSAPSLIDLHLKLPIIVNGSLENVQTSQ